MDDVLQAVRQWFALRSEAWLKRDYGELQRAGIPAVVGVEEMRRRDRLQRRRGAEEQKVIADIAVLSMEEARDRDSVHIEVAEHVRFLYELNGGLEHEQRVLRHELTFTRKGVVVMRAYRCLTEADVSRHSSKETHPPEGETSSWSGGLMEGARGGYDRIRAYRYAERWWNARNPQYQDMGVDCTNFTSQVMAAGGLSQHATGRQDSGWWYRAAARPAWSYSWAVANAFAHYLQRRDNRVRAVLVQNPRELKLGDVICYDWQGNGAYNHSTVVTAHDAAGDPLVNAHTVNSHKRYFSYEDSYAWTEHTRYLFVHFAD